MSGSDQTILKIHRFIGDFDLSSQTVTVEDKDLLHQWVRVLRFKAGENIILCNGNKNEIVGRIHSLDKHRAEIEVIERRVNAGEPKREVTLYCAILKRENFELALQKAVEVGVTRIVPVRSHRTVKLNIKRERLAAIIREAAEQSGRGILPVLEEPKSFPDAVGDSIDHQGRLFFDVYGTKFDPSSITSYASVCAFIGPEGGWSDEERAAAEQAGLQSVSLGPLVMRGETAAIVAGYLLGL